MSEKYDVTNPVLMAVSELGFFWRQNTGTFLTLDGKRYVKVCVDGAGDIMGAYRGRPVAIETKTARGKFRDTQTKFRDVWEKHGGIYIPARSVNDALAGLEAIT